MSTSAEACSRERGTCSSCSVTGSPAGPAAGSTGGAASGVTSSSRRARGDTAVPPAVRRARSRRCLARLRSQSTARYPSTSAGLAMARVLAAPRAVLAQRDPLGVVALALVRLVVAALALLAGEGD